MTCAPKIIDVAFLVPKVTSRSPALIAAGGLDACQSRGPERGAVVPRPCCGWLAVKKVKPGTFIATTLIVSPNTTFCSLAGVQAGHFTSRVEGLPVFAKAISVADIFSDN